MATIAELAENLITLNETKQALKTAIEGKGQDLTNVPFTEYAEKIVDIKNKIPTDTTATAEDIRDGKTAYVNGEKVEGTNTDSELIRQLLTRTAAFGMFNGCSQLTAVPEFDMSYITDMQYAFRGCDMLITIPELDTSKVTNIFFMCFYCKNMVTIPALDIRSVTNAGFAFDGCGKLQTCLIRNIKVDIKVGSGTSFGHLLTVESLIHLIYELRDTGSSKTLTIGNVNLEKLANVYVRTIDITDEMRAEDDLIDEKLPFEVCESTDEGAIQIVEYAKLKNWNIG